MRNPGSIDSFRGRCAAVLIAWALTAAATTAGERSMVYIGRPGGAEAAVKRMTFYGVEVAYFTRGGDWAGFAETLGKAKLL